MAKVRWEVVGALLVAALTACPSAAAAIELEPVAREPANTTMPRIRSADPEIADAIARATEWSQTFRRLVEAIGRTDGLVWVRRAPCGRHRVAACLVIHMTVAGPYRLLHVHVDPGQSGDDLMASIGHELQHAVEVLRTSAKTTAEMYLFFEYSPGIYQVDGRFETGEALQAGFAVAREVAKARKRRRSSFHQPLSPPVTGVMTARHQSSGLEPDDSPAPAMKVARIRTDDPEIRQAIAQATKWSETFLRLVQAIEQTDGIVWIVRGRCRGTYACLLMYLEVSGPHRLLRIHVDPRRSGGSLIESLGHELQHAVEVLGTSVRNDAGMFFLFEQQAGAYRVGGRFETPAALRSGKAVGEEVAHARRQQRTRPAGPR
jgi:hypothetical protein